MDRDMTRYDAKKIMENLAIISHYAAGGDIEFPSVTWDGEFVGWHPSSTMTLCCLGKYRITGDQMKVHGKINSHQLRGVAPIIDAVQNRRHGNCK